MRSIQAVSGALPDLARRLRGALGHPGSAGYEAATSPRNSTSRQEPLAAVLAETGEDVAPALAWASTNQVPVRVQASGHGAGHEIGPSVLLIDTSRLDAVEVDPVTRTARVGAGATIGAINAQAWRHGLLFPGGTAPDVAVTGYTAWGGVGWLTRPHGLASAALIGVDVVDATGRRFRADDEHDQDVLWAYRGGGGVGIATALTFRLFPAEQLWAGYALWPVDQLHQVAAAWGAALPTLHPALSTALALLHAPDAPTVPEHLRGTPVVHLSAAAVAGAEAGEGLLDALSTLPPAIQTFGPADVDRLATIHLDPPTAVPAVGAGRWLTAAAAAHVVDILTAAGPSGDPAVAELELRWVASATSPVAGALTTVPGPMLLHATGAGPDTATRRATQEALDRVLALVAPYDTHRSAAAFCDGQTSAVGALDDDTGRRLHEVRARIDPGGLIGCSRTLA